MEPINRSLLKTNAKGILSKNYWPVVCTGLICAAVEAVSSAVYGLGIAGMIFLSPILLGVTLYYVDLSEGKNVALGSVFTNAFNGKYYLRRVGGYAWMMLFTALWSMLFVIPGIIKGLSYSLTPYILAKYPEVPAKDALKLSMRFMNGRKGELFVLGLSFIGWCILAGLTFGILGIFYVIPYMSITVTLWQKQVMDSAIARGEFIYHPVTNA